MARAKRNLMLIGITDRIDIPEADIVALPCKIDTGADSSAIHCERVKIKEIKGQEYLSFRLLDKKHPLYNGKEFITANFKEKKIKSSFGDYEFRYQVKLRISLFGQSFNSVFNLSNRKEMKYPVLLGRRFLKNRFLVDVSQRDLSYNGQAAREITLDAPRYLPSKIPSKSPE